MAEESFAGTAGKVRPNATIGEVGRAYVKPARGTDSLFRQVVNDDVYIAENAFYLVVVGVAVFPD